MKVKILGRCGAFPQKNSANSSFMLSSEKTKLVVDFGDGVLSRLLNFTDLKDVDAIIISHLHFDHVIDMTILQYYISLNKIEKKLKVLVSEADSELAKIYFPSDIFQVFQIQENLKYSFGDIEIEFYEVCHPVKTFGFVAKSCDKALGYTADSKLCDGLVRIISNSNVAICDCAISATTNDKAPHATAGEMAKLCKKYGTKLLGTHICEPVEKLENIIGKVLNREQFEIVEELKDYLI